MEACTGKAMREDNSEWTRGHYLIVSVVFGGMIILALASTILDLNPRNPLPSCFDQAAKAKAAPGERCNPVF